MIPASNSILVGTDFSEASDEAIRQGLVWARDLGLTLTVCHVLPEFLGSNPLFPERARIQQELILELEQKSLREIELQVFRCTDLGPGRFRSIVETGVPATALVRMALAGGVQGIVVGGRHDPANSVPSLGATAERIVRYSPVSVLLARGLAGSGHVLAATDLSDPAVPVIREAAREARARSASLTILHCLELPFEPMTVHPGGLQWSTILMENLKMEKEAALAKLRASIEGEGVEAEILCESGNSTELILKTAEARQSDLIVVGSHGRTAFGRFFLGSVAENILRHARPSVRVVRLEGGGSIWLHASIPKREVDDVDLVNLNPNCQSGNRSRSGRAL